MYQSHCNIEEPNTVATGQPQGWDASPSLEIGIAPLKPHVTKDLGAP